MKQWWHRSLTQVYILPVLNELSELMRNLGDGDYILTLSIPSFYSILLALLTNMRSEYGRMLYKILHGACMYNNKPCKATLLTNVWKLCQFHERWLLQLHHQTEICNDANLVVGGTGGCGEVSMPTSLKQNCRHFDDIFFTGCTESCHFDNVRGIQRWMFCHWDCSCASKAILGNMDK